MKKRASLTRLSLGPHTRARARNERSAIDLTSLERAKAIATIFSAVAIPIVLTVAGYFIQKQLSEEGLRKDYVGIATAILKEQASSQEPELREWAVRVLDTNSPIPFSSKAKEGLLTGNVVTGPAWMGPPADCMERPQPRTVRSEHIKLADRAASTPTDVFIRQLIDFANLAAEQETDAQMTAARLACLQDWIKITEESDIRFRQAIGAPSSRSIVESLQRQQSASQPTTKSGSTR